MILPTSILLAATFSSALQPTELRGMELFNEFQRRAVLYFWQESHPETGFTKDRAANFRDKDEFDVSSCAATGFALTAYVIGVERGWLDREQALKRSRLTFRNLLTRHDHYKGWFSHWVKWQDGTRTWTSEYSTIDTSILIAGAIAAERYWKDPAITRDLNAILERIDWKAAVTDGGKSPNEIFVGHGYRPETGGWLGNRWRNYSEEKMLYLQLYGATDFSNEGWNQLGRTFHTFDGIEFITGGPLFIHQMSEGFYDFSNMRDALGINYWVATRNAILANRAYARRNPKGFKGYSDTFWGLSASDGPDGYVAFGAPGWIEDNGTITPTAAMASIYWTPREALAFANRLIEDHPKAWGRYGFSNALNPHRDWIGPDVIGIDLGMMLLNVENHRTGLIKRLSSSHPMIQRGYQRMGFRPAPDSNRGPLRLTP